MPSIMTRTPSSWTFTQGARFTRHGLESLKALNESLSTENHPNARVLIHFVRKISDPNDISATYKELSFLLEDTPLTSVPESPFTLVQAFIQLETYSSITFTHHKFHRTSDTITVIVVAPSQGIPAASHSDAGTAKDSGETILGNPPNNTGPTTVHENDFQPVKAKHTFSLKSQRKPTSDVDNASSKYSSKDETSVPAIVHDTINLASAKRSIGDKTAQCIKDIEKVYKDLQSSDENHCLKLRESLNKEKTTLVAYSNNIQKELDKKKEDICTEMDEVKRMSHFFSEGMKLSIDDALIPGLVKKVVTQVLSHDNLKALSIKMDNLKTQVESFKDEYTPTAMMETRLTALEERSLPSVKRSPLFPNVNTNLILSGEKTEPTTNQILPHSTLVRATSNGVPYNCYIMEHCIVDSDLHYTAETTDSNLISFPATSIIEILVSTFI